MTITTEHSPADEMGRLIDIMRGQNDRLEARHPVTPTEPGASDERTAAALTNLAGQLQAAYDRGRADERACWE
jgi:hypothetical protein